jgi:hypothetical protein
MQLKELYWGPKAYKHKIWMSYIDQLGHLNRQICKSWIRNRLKIAFLHYSLCLILGIFLQLKLLSRKNKMSKSSKILHTSNWSLPTSNETLISKINSSPVMSKIRSGAPLRSTEWKVQPYKENCIYFMYLK